MRSSSPSTILVTGATGQQGGAVIRALLRAGADVRILALTRSKDSAGTKKLAEHAEVEVVEGTFDDPEAVFDKAGEVDQLFLMSTFFDKGTEGEERQAKAMIDTAITRGVSQIVFTSVNRHGDVPTDVPHFQNKHRIEQHLLAKAADQVKWTIVRPVFFMENLPGAFFCRMVTATWAYKLGFDKPIQMIACDDIGEVGALSLLDPAKFNHQKIDLAGDDLTLSQVEEVHRRVRGWALPRTFSVLGWVATTLSKDLGTMFDFFRDVGYDTDIPACKRLYPGLQTYEAFLQAQGGK